MKKFISLILALTMMAMPIQSCVFAVEEGGFVGGVVEDMEEEEFNEYIVAYNDFESMNKIQLYGAGSPTKILYQITTTGEGKVFEAVAHDSGASMSGANNGGTYNYNGQLVNTLNEPIEANTKYIMSYDYRIISRTGTSTQVLSFAPQLAAFSNGNNDYKDFPAYYDYTTDTSWHKHAVAFATTESDPTTLNVKVHTQSANTNTYIDNYCVQKAASVTLGDGATFEKVSGYTIAPKSDANATWTAMGGALSFKINTIEGSLVDQVKMGSQPITADPQGVYTIPSVTDDITVTTKVDEKLLIKANSVVAFNDFGAMVKTDLYGSGGKIIYRIKTLEDGNKVFEGVAHDSYASMNGLNNGGNYTWNGKTLNAFNEPVDANSKYIMSYDYYLVPTDDNKTTNAFSFAPQIAAFSNGSGDWRDYPKYYKDTNWHEHKVAFSTAEGETALNVKVNTMGSNINSYIDNYKIQKAVAINVGQGVKLDIVTGSTIVPRDDDKALWTAMGEEFAFKLETENGIAIDEVKAGDEVLTADPDGVYSIDIVTGDISVTTKLDLSAFKDNYNVTGDNVTLQYQTTLNDIIYKTGLPSSVIKVTTSEDVTKLNDQYIVAGDKILLGLDGDIPTVYTVVITSGDITGDGALTVLDITAILDAALDGEYDDLYDLDFNDKITVTDAIIMRSKVLNVHENKTPDAQVIQKMEEYLADSLVAIKGFTPTQADLDNGIYNLGNRALLARAMEKAMSGETVNISTLGGSITQGAGRGNHPENIIYNEGKTDERTNNLTYSATSGVGYSDVVFNWWKEMFGTVNRNNVGIGSTSSVMGAYRLEDDVFSSNPDIVVVDYSVNDNDPNRTWMQGTYENIVRRCLEKDIAVILIGLTVQNGSTCESWHKPVADYYDVPFVSYSTYKDLTNFADLCCADKVHPNEAGHLMAGILISNLLTKTYKDLATTSTITYDIPEAPYYESGRYDDGAFIANISDIEDGKFADIELVSSGSFVRGDTKDVWMSKVDGYINAERSYYPYVCEYSASGNYDPMIIKVKDAKTAITLLKRYATGGPNALLDIYVDGVLADSQSSIMAPNHWNGNRLGYWEAGKDITIKLQPVGLASGGSVTLYSLFLAQAK